jgi:hypothetical protein
MTLHEPAQGTRAATAVAPRQLITKVSLSDQPTNLRVGHGLLQPLFIHDPSKVDQGASGAGKGQPALQMDIDWLQHTGSEDAYSCPLASPCGHRRGPDVASSWVGEQPVYVGGTSMADDRPRTAGERSGELLCERGRRSVRDLIHAAMDSDETPVGNAPVDGGRMDPGRE